MCQDFKVNWVDVLSTCDNDIVQIILVNFRDDLCSCDTIRDGYSAIPPFVNCTIRSLD